MTSEEIKQLDESSFMPTYGRFEAVLVSGKNATGVDCEGKEYIDFGSGIGVNSLGWADEGWTAAVAQQAGKLQHTSNLYYNPASATFAMLSGESFSIQVILPLTCCNNVLLLTTLLPCIFSVLLIEYSSCFL